MQTYRHMRAFTVSLLFVITGNYISTANRSQLTWKWCCWSTSKYQSKRPYTSTRVASTFYCTHIGNVGCKMMADSNYACTKIPIDDIHSYFIDLLSKSCTHVAYYYVNGVYIGMNLCIYVCVRGSLCICSFLQPCQQSRQVKHVPPKMTWIQMTALYTFTCSTRKSLINKGQGRSQKITQIENT